MFISTLAKVFQPRQYISNIYELRPGASCSLLRKFFYQAPVSIAFRYILMKVTGKDCWKLCVYMEVNITCACVTIIDRI